jgi:hypothetical protein
MAFGQSLGPPASSGQLKELLNLLHEAGYADFRSARGAMGFTQRQGTGKFTRDEASALIDQLQEAEFEEAQVEVPAAAPTELPSVLSLDELAMRRLPSEQLAAELQRRGWMVIEP